MSNSSDTFRTLLADLIDREIGEGWWEPLAVADGVIRELNLMAFPVMDNGKDFILLRGIVEDRQTAGHGTPSFDNGAS